MNSSTPDARTEPASPQMLPPVFVKAIGLVLLAILVSVAAVRLSGVDIRNPDAPAVQVRELRFEDGPDGSVSVFDARDGRQIHSFVGEAGFVRGTLRGLARERKRSGIGIEPAFELIGRADGRLTLRDPTTGRIVDLESFGPTNASAFALLMSAGKPQP